MTAHHRGRDTFLSDCIAGLARSVWPRRRSRSSSARSNRSCTRHSSVSPAETRRRSRHANHSPSPGGALDGFGVFIGLAKHFVAHRVVATILACARTSARRYRNQAATRFSLPLAFPRFIPSFQSPLPISGSPCTPLCTLSSARMQ